jgi:hypothetical protein
MNVSVEIKCPSCRLGMKPKIRRVLKPYFAYHPYSYGSVRCDSYDSELRHVAEGFGFYRFVFWPVRCRNGLLRWLTWVEAHPDGTYTLGNRAH